MAEQITVRDVPVSEIIKVLVEHEKENNAFIRHYEDVRFIVSRTCLTTRCCARDEGGPFEAGL